jgi:beta-phosphoglucomutase
LTPPDIISWRGKKSQMNYIDFTLEHNELLKGVAVRSLDIILEIGKVEASRRQKQMAVSKNEEYLTYLVDMDQSELLPGVLSMLHLKENQPISFGISQQKCKTYSGENGNQTLF